jgi:periplasmic protein TonB
MIRLLEFTPFLAAAVAAHVWAMGGVSGGAVASGGDQGAQEITLQGADPALQAMVADWMRPPAVVQAVTAMAAPSVLSPPTPLAPIPDMPPVATLPTLPSAPAFAPAPQAMPPKPSPRAEAKPRPEPKPRATAQAPAQRASGAGKQANAGQGGRAKDTAREGADSGALMAQWGGAIRSSVLRAQRAPATNARGTVHLRISVQANGQLAAVSVTKSSGHAALDAAAVSAVKRARLPAAPKGISGPQQFNLPVAFRG